MFSLIVWFLADYAGFALVVFIFTAVSVTMTLMQTRSFLIKLQEMARIDIEIGVFRGKDLSSPVMMSSSELIPGDIIAIPEGKIMPCDAILMNGLCIMNEAMLTGESIPVVKNTLPLSSSYYNANEDKQYTIFAGTTCIQSRSNQGTHVLGLVTNTGFMTLKGGLVRSMLFPRKSDFKFYTDALKFIVILVIISFVGKDFLHNASANLYIKVLLLIYQLLQRVEFGLQLFKAHSLLLSLCLLHCQLACRLVLTTA